jgi:hypothetical protein
MVSRHQYQQSCCWQSSNNVVDNPAIHRIEW